MNHKNVLIKHQTFRIEIGSSGQAKSLGNKICGDIPFVSKY
jgi:hypothetical protein